MICIPKVRSDLSPQKVSERGSLASNYKAFIHTPRQQPLQYHPNYKMHHPYSLHNLMHFALQDLQCRQPVSLTISPS